MSGNTRLTPEDLEQKLGEIIAEIGEKELRLDHDKFRSFCELTGHDYTACRARDAIPAGYLLTFINPAVSEMFIKLWLKAPRAIKGAIHTQSRIGLQGALRLSEELYRERLTIRKIEQKTGGKGEYLVVDLEVALMDKAGTRVASDLHQFFLRV